MLQHFGFNTTQCEKKLIFRLEILNSNYECKNLAAHFKSYPHGPGKRNAAISFRQQLWRGSELCSQWPQGCPGLPNPAGLQGRASPRCVPEPLVGRSHHPRGFLCGDSGSGVAVPVFGISSRCRMGWAGTTGAAGKPQHSVTLKFGVFLKHLLLLHG